MKRTLAFILILVLASQLFSLSALGAKPGIRGDAVEAIVSTVPPDPTVTITINGVPYVPGTSVAYHAGDIVEVTLTWVLDTDDYRFEGDSFTYDLGDILVDPSNRSGILYDSGNAVGTYLVDEDNVLHVQLDPEFADDLNRDVVITLRGTIPTDQAYDPEGADKNVRIGEQTVTVQPQYDESTAGLAKRVAGTGNVTLDENGRYAVEFEIEVIIDGNITELVIYDELGDGLYLPEDISNWFDFSFDFSDTLSHDQNPQVSRDGDGKITIRFRGEYHSGDKIIIRYRAYVDDKTMRELADGTGTVGNVADGTFTSNKGNGKTPIPPADADARVIPPRLSKGGAWVDDGVIEWRITLQTGSMGDLDALIKNKNGIWGELGITSQEALLEYLGLGKIVDTMGSGLTLRGNLSPESLTLANFEKIGGPYADGSCTYLLVFRTQTDGSQLVYSNSVSSSFFGESIGDTAWVGIEGDIAKDAEGVNEDGTMSWTITAQLPANPDLLTSFVIRETPHIPYLDGQNQTDSGEDYADIWTHRVIADSIRINGQKPGEVGAAVTQTRSTVSIEFNTDSAFFRQNAGKTVTITLQTEIVDGNGNRVGEAFDRGYRYTNTAQELIDGMEVGRDTANVEEQTKSGSLIDKEFAESSGSDELLWYVELREDFLYGRLSNLQGILAAGPYDLVLTDTLPENMVYVEGSAYAELNLRDQEMEADEVPVNLDALYALLSSALTVTPINERTVQIRWNMDEALRERIRNFELTDINGKSLPLWQGKVASDGDNVWGDQWRHIKLRIYYSTRLSSAIDYDDFGEDGMTFTNTVEGTANGSFIGRDSASAVLTRTSALTKTYDYDADNRKAWADRPDFKDYYGKYSVSANGLYNIYYQIDINPQRLKFGDAAGGRVTLIDTMGAGSRLIPDSIRIINLDDNNRVLNPSEYDVVVDFEKNSFQITLPDSTHFLLEYFTKIEDIDADNVIRNASNRVELYGEWFEMTETSDWPDIALSPAGFARSSDSFDVYKYYTDSSGDSRMLSGAIFRLTAYSGYDSATGEFIPITDEENASDFPNVEWVQTSNPTISFTSLHRNYIYRLEEIEAPPGFKKSDDVFYFIFSDYDAANTKNDKEQILALGFVAEIELGEIFRIENTPIDEPENTPTPTPEDTPTPTPEDTPTPTPTPENTPTPIPENTPDSTPTPIPDSTPDSTPTPDGSPPTGDDSQIGLWAALMTLSLTGIVTVICSRRRKTE